MPDNVVEVRGLSRRFGSLQALDHLDIDIQKGYVYGLVGANGAGKTTFIKHLLGLLRAEQGTVRVFGQDPVIDPVSVLQRIGYLSEERELPEWMRVDELLRYTAAFHPHWDQSYAEELLATFQLEPSKKVKHLSKGMRAQAGLIAAVAHRPELLLLDEPSTGLDPIVRKDILNAIVRTVADEGRTVIFSSHLLDEVELMSDDVLMFEHGRLLMQGGLDKVKEQHQWLSVRPIDGGDPRGQVQGVLSAEKRGDIWCVTCCGSQEETVARFGANGSEVVHIRNATLQEVFVARAGREKQNKAEA